MVVWLPNHARPIGIEKAEVLPKDGLQLILINIASYIERNDVLNLTKLLIIVINQSLIMLFNTFTSKAPNVGTDSIVCKTWRMGLAKKRHRGRVFFFRRLRQKQTNVYSPIQSCHMTTYSDFLTLVASNEVAVHTVMHCLVNNLPVTRFMQSLPDWSSSLSVMDGWCHFKDSGLQVHHAISRLQTPNVSLELNIVQTHV